MRKLLCIVLSVIATSALAGPIKGPGATTCGQWVEDRKKTGAHYSQLSWIQGFISSYNHYLDSHKDPNGIFGIADSNSVTVWMDNYCQKNPLNTVYLGTVELIEELKESLEMRKNGVDETQKNGIGSN